MSKLGMVSWKLPKKPAEVETAPPKLIERSLSFSTTVTIRCSLPGSLPGSKPYSTEVKKRER